MKASVIFTFGAFESLKVSEDIAVFPGVHT